ncbi:MAG: metallophosphoesterase [Pseudomonadota bacterium]|nr:metallophosphoesterase [Pseudomonadota bacterium]
MTKPLKINRCLRVPANVNGRDFVVGDLHGHRSLLEQALDELAFDQRCDRVLSVGDLIDRGPESLETLSLIEEPWFHAVLGNHELMLLNFLGYYGSRMHSRKSYASGGGEWITEAIARNPKAIARLAHKVSTLPLAMHVDGDVPFNVTHGDLGQIGSRRAVQLGERTICVHKADAATSSRVHFAAAMNSRRLGLRFAQHPVQISPSPIGALPITYVGHSPSRDIIVHDSYIYIDQGVCAPTSKRTDPTLPTVLEHRRFASWLHGAATARQQTWESSPPLVTRSILRPSTSPA